jgi:molybdenum cofactor cytidylyltransferase
MPIKKQKISSIILAAGGSSRLNGKSKQLLEFRVKTFLRRSAETALAANFHSIVVVLGANSENMRKEIEDLPVKIAVNKNWATGMSSSIKTGLAELIKEENLDAVVITLCDQPLVTTETLDNLRRIFAQTGKKIAACEYENTVGVPALFSSEVFGELMNLHESDGRRKLSKNTKEKRLWSPRPKLDWTLIH